VTREYFQLMSNQVFQLESGYWDKSVADRAHVLWFSADSKREREDFWFLGVILGLAVNNNIPGLDARFPLVLFKKLTDFSGEFTLEDLQEVHPSSATSLKAMLQWKPSAPDEVFEDIFCLTFTISYADEGNEVQEVNLHPSGEEVEVTMQNRSEFAKLYVHWLLDKSIDGPFGSFKKGFRRVCDSLIFSILTPSELQQIVCPEQKLDFEALRAQARYEGYTADEQYIQDFWDILTTADLAEKKRFLHFVTGSNLAPVGGLGRIRIKIQQNGMEPTDRLPSASTCFHILLLPRYGTKEKLQERLLLGLENAEGFGLE